MNINAITAPGVMYAGLWARHAAEAPMVDASKRHDAVMLVEVCDGNPNGDPDADNSPRVDPETGHGLITDVAIKRRVRNFISIWDQEQQGEADEDSQRRNNIYVEHHGVLNAIHQRAYTASGLKPVTKGKQPRNDVDAARRWMCDNFFDVRTFGAVMTTGVNCGQVRGPAQVTFGRSIDPIMPLNVCITRVAVTREEDAAKKVSEMGRKSIVPYALYRVNIFWSPQLAKGSGADDNDLNLLWWSLLNCWDHDRSASRGMMACRSLMIFSHDKPLGCAPAHTLFDSIKVQRKSSVPVARKFDDYIVDIPEDTPAGITLNVIGV